MNAVDLLTRLEAEGVSVSLNLKVNADAKPSDDTRALIRDNRDALLEHLAAELVENVSNWHQTRDGSNVARVQHLQGAVNGKRISQMGNTADVQRVAHLPDAQNYARVRNLRNSGTLQLYGDLLQNLIVWIGRYHELNVEHPNGVTLNAKPEQVAQHLTCSTWAVLYDETKTILATSGSVPARALKGKTALEPDVKHLFNDALPEKVVN